MAALRFFDVLTVADEVVEADPEWLRTVYFPIACPRCKAVLPQHEGPLDVDVAEGVEGPFAGVGFPVGLALFRNDFYGVFHPHMPEYYFGSMRVHGHKVPDYVSVFAGSGVRLPIYGDERSRYSACPTCGRNNERMAVGQRWFKRADVGDRVVFSDVGGLSMYVARSLLDTLPPALKRELKLSAIEVRG